VYYLIPFCLVWCVTFSVCGPGETCGLVLENEWSFDNCSPFASMGRKFKFILFAFPPFDLLKIMILCSGASVYWHIAMHSLVFVPPHLSPTVV
jgi:hypothetical protein